MTWPERIERWREAVLQESNGFPPDLILAIIRKESNGTPGQIAKSTTSTFPVPSIQGGYVNFNRAMGLMQVIPRTLSGYNDSLSIPVYYEEMTGTDERSARLQIRVGCSVLLKELKKLNKYDSFLFPALTPENATENQLKLAVTAYRRGFGALKKKLNKLKERGLALTFENLEQEFPLWGYDQENEKWINRVLYYVNWIWNKALEHGMIPGELPQPVPDTPLPDPSPIPQPGGGGSGIGFLFLFALVALAFWKGSSR